MYSVMRITSIEYYEAQDKTAKLEAGDDRNAGRDEMAYYTDNGQGESQGVWWTRNTSQEPFSSLLPSSPFGTNGSPVAGRHLRDLAAGRHPDTKESIVTASGNGKRSVGFDITISAPKSVSVLAAVGGEATRKAIFEAHDRAMRKALDYAFDSGLVVGRQTPRDPVTGKKTEVEVPVAEASAAVYRHFSSRAKDPQLHSHAVLMNLGTRPDGTTGALDNRRLMLYGGAIAAAYRAELSSILKEELGVETVRKGRNFEIAGIPEDVIDAFSKRRAAIEATMPEGKSTAANRAASQVASLETRDAKDREMSLEELEARWNGELRAMGWSGEALRYGAETEAKRLREQAKPEDRAERLNRLVLAAVQEVSRNNSVIDDRLLMRDAIEAVQTECSADEAVATIERLKASGDILAIGEDQGRAVYSTREIVEAEKVILRAAKARQGERDFVPADAIERAIKRRDTIRDEQAEAVRHALNRDGISIMEGSAGTGKSFSLGAVAEIARDCGLTPWVLAPSHKAKEVVRSDTDTAEEYAKAVQGFVNRIGKDPKKGGITLNRDSVVIVDEAGMVGTLDMERLVAATSAAGCKLILSGDTRQLQAVVAGAPMRGLIRVVGSSRMKEVMRQRDDWQKAASMDFAEGRGVRALEAYDRAGRVRIGDDREAVMAALVADYTAARKRPAFIGETNGRPVTRAILTSWNRDVREINERIRAAGREAGWITGEDWKLRVIPRGSDKPSDLAFAVGDDVIFGETVENVAGRTLYNADIARIVGIEGDPRDPTFRLQLAKDKRGETIEVRASELVGRREEGEEAVPRMQHASAMTVHASQGVTVDEAYVANFRGMGQETAYVAMTRHRQSVRMYADASRIVDQMAATGGKVIRQHQGGGTVMPEEGDRDAVLITEQSIKKRLFEETLRGDQKKNASDYMDLREILGETVERPQPVAETVARNEARPVENPAETVRPKVEPTTLPRPTPFDPSSLKLPSRFQPNPVAAQVSALRDRMAERTATPVRYPVPKDKPAAEFKGRITPEEKDDMVRRDLLRFAIEKLGGHLVEKWTGGGAVRFGDPKEGEKVGITNKGGVWLWTVSNDRSRKGTIIDLVRHVRGGGYGDAAHWVRAQLGSWRPSHDQLEAQRAARDTASVADPAKVRAEWARFPKGVSRYLTEERGISPEVAQRFAADVKADWTGEKAGNRFGVVFAHRTPDGEIVNFQKRGYPRPGKDASFRQNAPGGAPTLFMAGDQRPRMIYVTESAIDTLSLYQHDGNPAGAMLVAPDGTPGTRALAAIEEIARRNPDAAWNVALDNDGKGGEFAEQIKAAIRKGHAEAAIVDRPPGDGFKDWNGQLRNVTAEQEKAAKAERKRQEEEREKREAEARRIAEEEARRQVEAAPAVKVAAPRYVPR